MELLKIINHYRWEKPNQKVSRRTIWTNRGIIRKRQRTHKRRNSRQHTYNMAICRVIWNNIDRNIRWSPKEKHKNIRKNGG